MAVLNLAVDMDRLDKNRLKRLAGAGVCEARARLLEGWELLKLRGGRLADTSGDSSMAALQIGLAREQAHRDSMKSG
jgi:hypothetical protein